MARKCAIVPAAIWDDESFISLPVDAQLTYFMLRSQRNLDVGAMIPLTANRWATFTRTDAVVIVKSLRDLENAGWAYADTDLEEVFVSGVFAHEHIHKQPRAVIAAQEAIQSAYSMRLRALASAELAELVAGAELRAPRGIRAYILDRDGYRCRRCGWEPGDPVPLKRGTDRPVFRALEIDHIWPKSKGGADTPENFQVLCTSCNCRKGARI